MNVHSDKQGTGRKRTKRSKSAVSGERIKAISAKSRASKAEAPSADGSDRPRRGRPLVDDKRRLILDAALRVFAERGFHGTSVPEVAEAAGVGTGTLYRYFEHKEALVNEVYRDAKLRLRATLLDGLGAPTSFRTDDAERWFHELWQRLASFAANDPDGFRFLEMQDHSPYLDGESRQVELSVLGPLFIAGKQLRDHATTPTDKAVPVDILFALLWGAFVGLIKAGRLGYLSLDAARIQQAGHACWRMIEPGLPRTRAR